MPFDETYIREITQSVWSTMLGMPLEARGGVADARDTPPGVTSWVCITGSWCGAITIECSSVAARRAAGAMFGMAPEEASPEEVNDAMGEVANIIGGNLKGLLQGPVSLSLPTVGERFDFEAQGSGPGAVVRTAHFESEGEPLVVKVFARTITPPPLEA